MHARLLDPATALDVLTVDGISLFEATRDAQNHPNTIKDHILKDHIVARANQFCPLTRRGPSINCATEPDVVEHAGNIALMCSVGRHRHTGLGVVSLNGGFNPDCPLGRGKARSP